MTSTSYVNSVAIKKLENVMPKGTYKFTSIYTGYITSDTTSLCFFVPLPHSLSGRSIKVNTAMANIRAQSKYVQSPSGYVDNGINILSLSTSVGYRIAGYGVVFEFIRSSKWTNCSNNIVVSVSFSNFTFTVS